MANKFLLKKSSVASKVPLTTDVDFGELALNYADGKLYYKTSGSAIDYFDSVASTATLTNKTLTSPTINSGALSGTFTGSITLSDTTASTSTTTGAVNIAINTPQEFNASAHTLISNWLDTDKVVIKYYANLLSGNNPQYSFKFGDAAPVRA